MNGDKPRSNIDIFYDLKRRVSITRKSRISASKRLRKRHEFFEKVTHFYSLLILILSVWFMNIPDQELSLMVTKMLLILSLSLTFFTMFLGTKNYKERAGNFETNYQHLDVLLNKIERLESRLEDITDDMLKGLHREYEKLLIEKENHQDIDYKASNKNPELNFTKDIRNYKIRTYIINTVVAIYPLILIMFIYLVDLILGNF